MKHREEKEILPKQLILNLKKYRSKVNQSLIKLTNISLAEYFEIDFENKY